MPKTVTCDPYLLYSYRLTFGDWSGDGHEKTEDVFLVSNTDAKTILAAYTKSCQEIGVSLSPGIKGASSVCVDYEDPYIRDTELAKLEAAGFVFGDDNRYPDSTIHAHVELLVDLFVWLVKRSCPSCVLQYEENTHEQLVGGYGLPSIGYGVFE